MHAMSILWNSLKPIISSRSRPYPYSPAEAPTSDDKDTSLVKRYYEKMMNKI